MRKNINKLVAVAIGVSIISGSIIPVFAADTNTQNTSTITSVQAQVKPVLTLDNAIDAAISNSDKVALQIKKINLEDDKLDIQEDIDDDGFPYDKLELLVDQSKEQKGFTEDQIAQDITDKYNDIVAKGKELNKLKKQIQIKTKEIQDTELKQKLGLITSIDVKKAKIELETLNNSEKDKENKFKNSQDYFKVLTDKDLTKCTLEENAKYEVFKIDGSVDEYLDDVIDKYLKYDNEILDLSNDNIKDNKVEHPNQSDYTKDDDNNPLTPKVEDKKAYQDALGTYGAYLEAKYNVSSGIITLNETKKSLKNGLKESYASLLDLENSINVKKNNIEVNNKQLSISKLKYDTGLITKTQYDNEVLASEDLETSLRTLIDNYNKLKNSIQKPWLVFNK